MAGVRGEERLWLKICGGPTTRNSVWAVERFTLLQISLLLLFYSPSSFAFAFFHLLQPWITPSLFYQFLGGNENSTAFDIYTFCKVLGPEEANRQLRRHWDTWVTEDIIEELYQSGAVNSLRLPIGDFMYKPYGPYRK